MRDFPDLEEVVAWIDRPDREPLDLVTEAVILSGRLDGLADQVVDHFVQRARDDGASWAEIGASLGVSKQAAQKRFVEERSSFRLSRSGLFTRFDGPSRHAVQEAMSRARTHRSMEIDTLHLVVGLTESGSGRAHEAISAIAGSADAIGEAAGYSLAGPKRPRKVKHIPFSDDCKKVLELSLREAIHAKSRSIGSEYILLGLLRHQDSAGARLLKAQGVTTEAVRSWLDENPAD